MEDLQNQNKIITNVKLFETDDDRIQNKINEFYDFILSFDGTSEKILKLKIMRNNVLNMMDTYLKKFNSETITKEFYGKLKKARIDSIKNNKINKYTQYMNEIRVLQEYKGIQENIASKLADDFVKKCLEIGEDVSKSKRKSGNN